MDTRLNAIRGIAAAGAAVVLAVAMWLAWMAGAEDRRSEMIAGLEARIDPAAVCETPNRVPVRLRNGHAFAVSEVEIALFALNASSDIEPFRGWIAGMETRRVPGAVNAGEERLFCTRAPENPAQGGAAVIVISAKRA